jgi:hypothetical protein
MTEIENTTVINLLDQTTKIDPKRFYYIGRAFNNGIWILNKSIFHNPFKLEKGASDKERNECIAKYKEYILQQPKLLDQLHQLKGKQLACFCKPKACHGQVLIELLKDMNQRKAESFERKSKN